jgi:pimeloyl-ACP methyl ester carboxylesterase
MAPVTYRTADVDGFKIFYREAGPAAAPKLLLLHGFPTSSQMFRDLIPLLADRFHMVAPDLPGFGQSDMPPREKFKYTFENIAGVVGRFTEVVGFDRFAVYVFDYGAPTGFRLAVRHPERITAIISQNGNAYEEGLSDGWTPIRAYWENPSQANRDALRAFLTPQTTHWQYTHGVPDPTMVSPDGQNLDNFYLARPGADEIQLDLFGDYRSNVASILPSKNTFARTSRRFSRCGARTIHSFFRRAPKRSGAIFLKQSSASWTPAISRSRPMPAKSPQASAISFRLEGLWEALPPRQRIAHEHLDQKLREHLMPLAKIYVREGRYSEPRIDAISASLQAALINTLGVPPDDFFQLIFEMPQGRFRHSPGFVGMHYTDDFIIIELAFIEGRPAEKRLALLKDINTRVSRAAKISPDDMMIAIAEAPGVNFSFGRGEAQRANLAKA